MGWAIGYDSHWDRDVGYGVPALCDHPDCKTKIDRGLGYVCGGEPYGGEKGCGLYFCDKHGGGELCERCAKRRKPFAAKPDVPRWMRHKLTHASWARWRKENPTDVAALRASLSPNGTPARSVAVGQRSSDTSGGNTRGKASL